MATASVLLRYDNTGSDFAPDIVPGAFPPYATTAGGLAIATGFSYIGDAPRAGAPFMAVGNLNSTVPGTGRATGRLAVAQVNYTRGGGRVTPACAAEAAFSPVRVRSFAMKLREQRQRLKRTERLRQKTIREDAAAARGGVAAAKTTAGEGNRQEGGEGPHSSGGAGRGAVDTTGDESVGGGEDGAGSSLWGSMLRRQEELPKKAQHGHHRGGGRGAAASAEGKDS